MSCVKFKKYEGGFWVPWSRLEQKEKKRYKGRLDQVCGLMNFSCGINPKQVKEKQIRSVWSAGPKKNKLKD